MRPETYLAENLASFLRRNKIATLDELKEVLGTDVDSTVFRKLQQLSYCSSYSHRGRYYTLAEVAHFDNLGLWAFRSVWFSRYGTLLATVRTLVEEAEAGYLASELDSVLHVDVKAPLLKLVRNKQLAREKVSGRYVYLSCVASERRRQLSSRQVYDAESGGLRFGVGVRVLPTELKAAIVLFYSLLDEKQRRLYAGLESLKIGHGGDQQIAELLCLDRGTIARGRQELLARDVEIDRIRREGGGCIPLEKKRQKSSRGSKRS